MKFVVSMKLNVRLLCLFQLHTRKKKSNKNYNKMSCTEVKRYISRYLAAWVAKQDTAKSCPLSKPGQPNNIRFTLFRLSKFSTVTFSHHSRLAISVTFPKGTTNKLLLEVTRLGARIIGLKSKISNLLWIRLRRCIFKTLVGCSRRRILKRHLQVIKITARKKLRKSKAYRQSSGKTCVRFE